MASVCLAEGRALATLDLGFADIRAYPPGHYPGLVVLRPGRQSKARVMDMVGKILPMLETERIAGSEQITPKLARGAATTDCHAV